MWVAAESVIWILMRLEVRKNMPEKKKCSSPLRKQSTVVSQVSRSSFCHPQYFQSLLLSVLCPAHAVPNAACGQSTWACFDCSVHRWVASKQTLLHPAMNPDTEPVTSGLAPCVFQQIPLIVLNSVLFTSIWSSLPECSQKCLAYSYNTCCFNCYFLCNTSVF